MSSRMIVGWSPVGPNEQWQPTTLDKLSKDEKFFEDADAVIALHAQIGGESLEPCIENNVTATEHVLDACRRHLTE